MFLTNLIIASATKFDAGDWMMFAAIVAGLLRGLCDKEYRDR